MHNDAVPLGVVEGRFDPLNAAARDFVNAPATPANSYLVKSSKLHHVESQGHRSHQGCDSLTGHAINDDCCLDTRLESFSHTHRSDRIANHDETHDQIDFRNCDGNSILPGIQEFIFIGDDAFTKDNPGQLRYSNGVLMAELNGDSIPDFERKLLGSPVLTADSFLL